MRRVTVSFLLASVLAFAGSPRAERIEFRFTGAVVSTQDPDLLPPGQSMVGSYTFESDAVDIYGAEQGIFREATNTDFDVVVHLRVESGGWALETPEDRLELVNAGGTLLINRNAGIGTHHSYGIYFQRNLDGRTWSPPLHGADVFRVYLQLIDENLQAIVDPSILPLEPPDLEDFTIRRLQVFSVTDGSAPTAEFSIDSLTRPAVRLVPGTRLALTDPPSRPAGRKIAFRAKSALVATPAPGPGDPTQIGGVLRVANAAGGGDDALLALPAAGWKGLGRPAGAQGWKYADPRGALGPCRSAIAKRGKEIAATCKGAAIPFTLDEPSQGAIAVSLALGDDEPVCVRFGGAVRKDRPAVAGKAGVFQAKNAPALTCPLP